MKKGSIILIGIIVIYILLKLLLVASQRDAIFEYHEFFSGTIAMELIQGSSLPLKYCMPNNYSYGSIVNGILIVPFYLLFGPSSASSKMVSILFSLGVLVFWYLLLKRFFNRRVAIIASLLFIFSPTVYTKSSVLSVGSHPESNLFTAIIIFILYLIFFNNRKANIYFMLLGLSAGFAFFYSYLCGVTLLVLFIFWFVFDRRFILRPQFYLFLIFFLMGFSPRFYFAGGGKPAFEGVILFLNQAFNWNEILSFHTILKTKTFLLKDLPRLFTFEHLPDFFRYIYYFSFLMSFLFLLWFNLHSIYGLIPLKLKKRIISKESVIIVFLLIFPLIYILSRYATWPGWACAGGYIFPLYPFIFVIIALFVERMICTKNRFMKIASAVVLGFILLVGLYENVALISFHKIGIGFIYKYYSYRFFGERVGAECFANDRIEMIRKIDFSKRRYFLEGLGWGVARCDDSEREARILREDIIKRFPFSEQDRLHYYKGLGRGLAHRMDLHLYYQKDLMRPYNLGSDLDILCFIGKKKARIKRYFWEGFGQEVNLLSDTYRMIEDYLEDQFKPYFYRGIGEATAWQSLDEDWGLDFLFNNIDSKYREDAYSGYRETRSEMLLKDHR